MYPINLRSITGVQNNHQQITGQQPISQQSFDELLQQEIAKGQTLTFSKHAMERLQQRKIELTPNEIQKIDKALDLAAQKGVKETLILMKNKTFIASVSKKMIITATTNDQLKENIFTNIDGAVFI